jgi:hypothetical protein
MIGSGWAGASRLRKQALVVAVVAAASASGVAGQQDTTDTAASATAAWQDSLPRPVPAPVVPPAFFRNAVAAGTRTRDGRPGPKYWEQWTTYDIQAKLDPATAHLVGTVEIAYQNRSPQTLHTLGLHLYQNLQAKGVARHEAEEVTGGIKLTSVVVDSQEVSEGDISSGPGYKVDGTVMTLRPVWPVQPGDTVHMKISFEETLPQSGAGRMGWSDHDVYLVAYWFPKMAVYDDLRGWDDQPYLGQAEFYEGYGDYHVSLTVPAGWTAWATGTLANPKQVYSSQTLARLAEADSSDDRVVVATPQELEAGTVTAASTSGTLTYDFDADSVRDFTWTTSDVQRWDATSAVVGDSTAPGGQRRVLINTFWRENRAPLWSEQWKYAKESVEYHSRYTGYPYPWPHMTLVEGADIIGGGMEFPMMTLIGAYKGAQPSKLFDVTAHEIGHMWIPMIVGSNENRHAWIDEGSATFLEDQALMEYWPGVDYHLLEEQSYLKAARAGEEQSMMRAGDYYPPGPGYVVASYSKPASLMAALREVMGTDAWTKAYRTFISEWAFKHPTPWDFFDTFQRFAKQNLDWMWSAYYYETWTLDQAVLSVDNSPPDGPVIVLQDRGTAPFPTTVQITTTGGGILSRQVGVEQWLKSGREVDLKLPASVGAVTQVQLDPQGYAPDIDRSNDFWPRG